MRKEIGNLLDKARQGDVEAFAAVFEEFRPLVFAIAYRSVGAAEADDVVMETYIKAWKAIPRYQGQSSLKTWLYRITHNTAVDFLRKRKRQGVFFVSEHEMEDSNVDSLTDEKQLDPALILEKSEVANLVNEAMAQLESDQRITLSLRFSDGLSYKEIAAATGVRLGTVMSRLFNAKKRLKKLITSLERRKNRKRPKLWVN